MIFFCFFSEKLSSCQLPYLNSSHAYHPTQCTNSSFLVHDPNFVSDSLSLPVPCYLRPTSKTCHLQIDTCHLPLHMSCFNCWPWTHPERSSGWRSGMKHSVLWENWQKRSLDSYFQEAIILWAQFLHLVISRKALKSFMVMSAPCDYQ